MDPGWLFVAAGVTLCVAGVLIPAQQNLGQLRGQLTRIEQLHAQGRDGIEAHERFLQRLRDRDPAVVRRLAAAQLNLMPAGDTPVLVASSRRSTVMDWIGRSVAQAGVTSAPATRTWLTVLTDGTRRLWVLGVGVVLVFVGLLVDGRSAVIAVPTRTPPRSIPRWQAEDLDEPDDSEGPVEPDVTDEVEWSETAGEEEEEEDDAWDDDAGEEEEDPDEAEVEYDEEEDEDEDDDEDDDEDEAEDDDDTDGEWEEGEDSEWEEDEDEDEEDDDDEEEEEEVK